MLLTIVGACNGQVELDPAICRKHDGDDVGCVNTKLCLYTYVSGHPDTPHCLPPCRDTPCPVGYHCTDEASSAIDGNFIDGVCLEGEGDRGPSDCEEQMGEC